MGLIFRFPVPFAGYLSGFEAILPAMLAVFFYGVLLGGLLRVGVLGAIGGVVTAKLTGPLVQHQRRAVRVVGDYNPLSVCGKLASRCSSVETINNEQ